MVYCDHGQLCPTYCIAGYEGGNLLPHHISFYHLLCTYLDYGEYYGEQSLLG